jgi:hypothetical protein
VSFFSNVHGFLRFASGVKRFVGESISVENARKTILQRMAMREIALLEKIELAIFANLRSPYLKLFRAAGCEIGDLKSLVTREGVEPALRTLHQSGIYVTFDEFKGRTPAVRGSQTFVFRDTDFDNPLITPHFHSSSGGTRGRPTRILIDLDHVAQSAPHWALWFAAHDWLSRPLIFWTPSHSGVANRHLLCAKFGKRYVKWFSSVGMGTLKDRIVAPCVHGLVRWGTGCGRPEFVPLDEAAKVGEYLAGLVRQGMKPCIITSPSEAVRVCLAMQDRRMSLSDVTFLLGAEPLTAARKGTIEAAGAEAVPTYGFSEGGNVGSQCPNPGPVDDVHISLDAYAVIQREQDPQGVKTASDGALLLTALRPACPKVLLNTEIGDCAVLEERRCGCLFDEVGYVQHLHTIRSFQKITGFGVTFVGADLFHLLEDVLPRRFGGSLTDYQLVEEQDARGEPRYTLFVSPEVALRDEKELVEGFLEELGKLKNHYRYMVSLWAQADVLHVKRQRPLPTGRGKILPYRTLGAR